MMTQTLNIALPRELVEAVDQVAKKEYRNRSELIREALRVYIADRQQWEQIFAQGEVAMKEMGLVSEDQVDQVMKEYRDEKVTA